MSATQRLKGQTALITGGSSGIGACVAAAFAEARAAVGVNYAKSSKAAESVVEQICGRGGKAITISGDVARQDDVRAMFDAVSSACRAPAMRLSSHGRDRVAA